MPARASGRCSARTWRCLPQGPRRASRGGIGRAGGSTAPAAGGGPGEASYRRRTPVKGGAFLDESAARAVFLARDGAAGWAELCRMVTAAHATAAEVPLVPWDALRGEGVFVLLGPGSEVGRALAAGRPDRAARLLAPWREIYGDSLRLEAVHHGRTGTGPGSLRLAARTVGFAVEQGVPAVLTNAVRYADPGQGPVADILDAARRLVPIDRRAPSTPASAGSRPPPPWPRPPT